MNNPVQYFKTWLHKPTDPYILGLFRIGFGLFMAYEILDYFRIGLIRNMFVLPAVNFQYDFFRWLHPLPEVWMNILLGALLLCALLITAGIYFKWACRFFTAGYLYIFLLDKSIYNNHLYLFILFAFLLSFTDADKVFTIYKGKQKRVFRIPNWQIFILQFQIIVVYFFGGIAKLKADWLLECQPVKNLIVSIPDQHLLAGLLKNDFGIYLFTYGGLLLDLGAPLLLWNKNLRNVAIIPFILFHLLNSIIFHDIGIFPFVMLFSLILFFDSQELPILRRFSGAVKHPSGFSPAITSKFPFVLGVYMVFQLLFPLRGHFLPNDQDWTTIGNRFSWRMKVDTRSIDEMSFLITDLNRGESQPVAVNRLVNDMQILNMSMDPRSVKDFTMMLEKKASEMGFNNISVTSSIKVSYNGRESQYYIRPDVDLTNVNYSPLKKLDWVLPVSDNN